MKFCYFFFFIVVLSACKKEPTSWNSDWQIPVLKDTLDLANYYNDSTLSLNGSQIDVALTRTLLDIGLAELIQIPDTTISQQFQSVFTVNNVTPGFTFVNSVKTHELDLQDILLKKVSIKSGRVKLKVFNPLNTDVLYQVELPGVKLNGQAFVQNFVVGAGTVQNPTIAYETIDLSQYDIDLGGLQGLEFNQLQSKLTLKTDPNGPTVSIYANQLFKFEASFQDIALNYATGYFGSTILDQQQIFHLPYLNQVIAGSLDLPNLSMDVTIENGFKVALRGQISSLQATNTQGQSIALQAPLIGSNMFLAPALGAWSTLQPSTMQLHFDATNSNLENYLENLGAQQEMAYQLQVNPWGNTSAGHDEAFPNSRLKVKVAASMPLKFAADGLTLQDTFELNIQQDINRTHVMSGAILLEATNAFPFATDIVLYFLKDGQLQHTVVADAQISAANLGQVDPMDGLQKKKSNLKIPLPEAILNQINELNQVVVQASFATLDPNTGLAIMQDVQANAFLAFKLNLQLKTNIRP
ncbi:MAG: hypothetical protein ACKOBN_03975 [Flavobacteriales bacterium]